MALIREHRIVELWREVDVFVAREMAARMAADIGFDPFACAAIETALSELCTNVMRHVGAGWAVLRVSPGLFEAEIVDEGTGFEPSSASTGLGVGLDGARRLMDDLEIDTGPTGSTVTVRKHLIADTVADDHIWALGAANRLKRGSTVSGDGWWSAATSDRRLLLGIVDGLGSGRPAAEATACILDSFAAQDPGAPLDVMMLRAHEAARSTRGGVALLVRLGVPTLEYCGFGDLDGRIEPLGETLVLQPGIVGGDIGQLSVGRAPWDESAQLAVWTDGFRPDVGLWRSAPSSISPEWIESAVLQHGSERDDGLLVMVQGG